MTGSFLKAELGELIRQRSFYQLREIRREFPVPAIVEIFTDLRPDDAAVLLRILPRNLAAEVFEHLSVEDQETAIAAFKKYDVTMLPVADSKDVLVGVITVDDVLDLAEKEATEDIQKLGGMEALDAPYLKINLFLMIQKRAGWLAVLFVGEMFTATAMGYFEDEIAKAVVLALFVPLIISSGGNSGSQATSLIIRALAVRDISLGDWWRVMKRELIAGFALPRSS